MKTKKFTFNVVSRDTKTIVKAYRKPLILVTALMGFLIFFLNIFLGGALYGNKFNMVMKDKLGIYVYLKDAANLEKDKIVDIKTQLEEQGLRVEYSSKADALSFVEKRVPDLTRTLKKYNLDNPLPSTLYIMYNNQEQFKKMKIVLFKNRNLIMNMEDISENTVKTQEKRMLDIINLSNFLQSFAYLFVGVMVLAIITFTIFFLRAIFSRFIEDIQAKKLLWASAYQIIQPFLNVIFIALWGAFLLWILCMIGGIIPLNTYLQELFDVNFILHLCSNKWKILAIAVIEMGVIMLLLMGISYHFVGSLHRKLR